MALVALVEKYHIMQHKELKILIILSSLRFIRTELSSIIFNSNGGESFPNGMKCYANGQFEKMILDIVNK